MGNLFADIPADLPDELTQTLFSASNLRIERIVSKGHRSPDDFWYDQADDEWVLLLQGEARVGFADAESVTLKSGDYWLIKAHCLHRVEWTTDETETIWLAVHFKAVNQETLLDS